MNSNQDHLIKVGDYVVIQRWNFMKIIHFGGIKGNDFNIVLGNDIVDIKCAIDQPLWSTLKLVPNTSEKKSKKRLYITELCNKNENPGLSAEIIKDLSSGSDNRDIKDDGKSQNLSTQNINELRESGTSAQNIVEHLIENSTTFQKKTEFAQEKYLSKKKRKYFDYLLLRPTSLRLMIEINNKKDPSKFLGMTMDTISQMVTACNIQPGGNYLTYENGGSGIISAMLLNYLDNAGKVIQVHPGAFPQKSCVLSLNLCKEKLECYVPISIRDIKEVCKNLKENITRNKHEDLKCSNNIAKTSSNVEQNNGNSCSVENGKEQSSGENLEDKFCNSIPNNSEISDKVEGKRKMSETQVTSNKKPCYEYDVAKKIQVENILFNKVDGLILACKEHPLSILEEFIQYVSPSRPIIVYSLYREPLVELFMEMKTSKLPVINVRLTESFLRSYQVLPERTHPHMSMLSTGGFLLTATVVEK